MTETKMNQKVDSRFDKMHSNFFVLDHKNKKMEKQLKNQEFLAQNWNGLPNKILNKYSQQRISNLESQKRNLNGKKISHETTDLAYKSEPVSVQNYNDRDSQELGEIKKQKFISQRESRGRANERKSNLAEEDYLEIKNTQVKAMFAESQSQQSKKNISGVSEGLKNLSVTKIGNKFTKMGDAFGEIEVNKSYLENGFKNMKHNFILMGAMKRNGSKALGKGRFLIIM